MWSWGPCMLSPGKHCQVQWELSRLEFKVWGFQLDWTLVGQCSIVQRRLYQRPLDPGREPPVEQKSPRVLCRAVGLELCLPQWLRGKASAYNAGDPGFDPWVGKILWRRKWQPTPIFLPGKSHGWRSLEGYSPWGLRESETTERLQFQFQSHWSRDGFFFKPGLKEHDNNQMKKWGLKS